MILGAEGGISQTGETGCQFVSSSAIKLPSPTPLRNVWRCLSPAIILLVHRLEQPLVKTTTERAPADQVVIGIELASHGV